MFGQPAGAKATGGDYWNTGRDTGRICVRLPGQYWDSNTFAKFAPVAPAGS